MFNYYEIEISGKYVKNLFSNIISNKISMYDIKYNSNKISFKVTYENYLKIKTIKTTCNVSINKTYGKNKLVLLFNKYKVFFISFVLSLIIIYLFSHMAFFIKINNNNKEINEILKQEMISNNLTIYSFKKPYKKLKNISNKIKDNNKDLFEWLEISTNGVYYEVDYIERKSIKEDINNIKHNIIASKNGLIKKLDITKGSIVKNVGDYVSKNDLIVTGIITKNDEIKNDNEIRLYGILNGLLRLDNVDIYITESNSKFLSSDVLTEFRGRGDEVRVYPLSFSEYYSSCANKDKLDVGNEYSMFGGMPALILKKTDEEKIKYLKDFINNTYIKDVIERNNIKNNTVIDSLFNILASSIGSLTNPTKLANTFKSNGIKVTDVTLSNYINMLKDSFIIEQAERYDIKGKKYINSPFKYYFTDIGLRNSRINYRQQEQTHIMENIIYNELIIRGFAVDVGIIEHTIRDKEKKQKQIQLEVDFVCNKGMNKYYIQSAFSIPNEEKMNQETSSLDKINDSFKKIIVTQDFGKPWKTEKGYLIINIIDFLLDSNSLDL